MARIRTIKPDFFRHGGLFDAEKETGLPLRIAFAGLWTASDREGRFQWRPRELKLDALPFDDVDFSRVLDALRTRGYVRKYTVAGIEYGLIPSWSKHQVINNREAASTIPDALEFDVETDTSTREQRVSLACVTPLVQLQGEGKGREGDIDASSTRPKKRETTIPKDFAISDRVKEWAAAKGHSNLNAHLEFFVGRMRASGKKYIDWDEAFMNCIRENWGKIEKARPDGRKAVPI